MNYGYEIDAEENQGISHRQLTLIFRTFLIFYFENDISIL